MQMRKILSATTIAVFLFGCGGGEGGSDNIQFEKSQLSFSGKYGSIIAPQEVSVNVGLGADGTQRYVGVNNLSPSVAWTSYNITHIDALTMTITPQPGLPIGKYNGTAEVLVCKDEGCSEVIDRATYSYSISIQ